ncbi:MAG: hypothetical protein QM582_09425 [Micropruina sp.]|uniref:hypothetical protein n=1 Tax=Micropruina sp. TaxID=2737536 RepID=UPI0039E71E88
MSARSVRSTGGPVDRVVDDIERAVRQWRWCRARGLSEEAALLDLATACEWLLQQPAAARAQAGHRTGRTALGVLIVVAGLSVLAAVGLAVAWVMLRVAP